MLSNYVSPDYIKINLESTEKEECLAELLEVIVAGNPLVNRREAMQVLEAREEKSSTSVLPYVAIPHAICKSIQKSTVAIGISRTGIDFDPTANIIFEILMAEKDVEFHMNILKDIVQLVSNKSFINKMLNAKSSQEVLDIIVNIETADE